MGFARFGRTLRIQRSKFDPLDSDDRPSDAFENSWRRHLKRRVLVVLSLVGLWVIGIEARLVQLQVFQHKAMSERARRNQELAVPLEALRGDIVDRHGQLLAYSVEADSITADPSKVEDPAATAGAVCDALGDCTTKERRDLTTKLTGENRYAVVRLSRAVSPEQVAQVEALKLKGIVTKSDTRRYYPRFDLAAHVLGFVDLDNNGQAGVEHAFEKVIHGEDGKAFVEVDAKRRRLDSRIERAPINGATLELTIDLYLQHIVERELKAGVEANRASGGTAIIMDPSTGEILALASYPTFNPNAIGRSSDDARRNRAVTDAYEPGSTFKIVTASAALEEGIVKPTDLIDTNPGSITFPGRKPITEASHHNYGVIPFEDVIIKSSNVGAIKVGLRTGAERLSRYVHRFGFGEALARDFVGQSRGLWNPDNLNESGLASVSMGYQVSVTPLQMVTAASAVANGGLLMEPHLVRATVRNGRRQEIRPNVLRRAISVETAATLTTMMEGVVSPRGTAHLASLERYQVAGKTGTAHKAVSGGYSETDFNASFVGFVPSRRPAFTILVVIDTPRAKGHFGGLVAAPIFKRIAEAALQQDGVPPTVDPAPPVIVTAEAPTLPERPARETALVSSMPAALGGPARMPDVSGLSAREAIRVLNVVGVTPRLRGSGFVVKQVPEPGARVDAGGWGVLDLQRSAASAGGARGVR